MSSGVRPLVPVDENLERILLEQSYSAVEASKLTTAYTFRLHVNELIFDGRDLQEILELSRVFPETYRLKMYKYTPEEYKERQELQRRRAHLEYSSEFPNQDNTNHLEIRSSHNF